jgi:hypothetical protein
MPPLSNTVRRPFLIAGLTLVTGCAQTSVRPIARIGDASFLRPTRILVYDFAISETSVKEYQGIMRQQPSNRDPIARQREIARIASESLTLHLIKGLRQLGFVVERATRDAPVDDHDLIIDGRFVSVDEGSPLRRLVIGFGSGATTMTTRVQVLAAGHHQKILEFATEANSGSMPGAAATVPVSAAVPFGISVGLSAGGAVATGLNRNSSNLSLLAASSADQAVRFLSQFFAKQRWIRADQVRIPRLAY